MQILRAPIRPVPAPVPEPTASALRPCSRTRLLRAAGRGEEGAGPSCCAPRPSGGAAARRFVRRDCAALRHPGSKRHAALVTWVTRAACDGVAARAPSRRVLRKATHTAGSKSTPPSRCCASLGYAPQRQGCVRWWLRTAVLSVLRSLFPPCRRCAWQSAGNACLRLRGCGGLG